MQNLQTRSDLELTKDVRQAWKNESINQSIPESNVITSHDFQGNQTRFLNRPPPLQQHAKLNMIASMKRNLDGRNHDLLQVPSENVSSYGMTSSLNNRTLISGMGNNTLNLRSLSVNHPLNKQP